MAENDFTKVGLLDRSVGRRIADRHPLRAEFWR